MTDNRIPFDIAVRQVAKQTGLSEEKVRQLARGMLAVKAKMDGFPGGIDGIKAAIQSAALAEQEAAKQRALQHPKDALGSVELASRRVSEISPGRPRSRPHKVAPGGVHASVWFEPVHPANRRTFRFAGKPYYFWQDGPNRLHLKAGESPWT